MVGYDSVAPARQGHDPPGDLARPRMVAKALKFMTPARLGACGTLHQRMRRNTSFRSSIDCFSQLKPSSAKNALTVATCAADNALPTDY
jgi:hypothetical protein